MFNIYDWRMPLLNDIKDWALEKGDQSKEFAQGVAEEVQTTGAMDWSGSVWLVILGAAAFVLVGIFQR